MTSLRRVTPMSDKLPDNVCDIRKKHNMDLIRRMRDGDPLKSFDSRASWFPPRPVIEKDEKAVAKLYGKAKGRRHDDEIVVAEQKPGMAPIVALDFQKDGENWNEETPEVS
jgi:hypothetical protein